MIYQPNCGKCRISVPAAVTTTLAVLYGVPPRTTLPLPSLRMSPGRPPLGAALLLLFASRASSRDNLTCADGQDSDWWNNSDGLNPCEQYQQLMQICDPTCSFPFVRVESRSTHRSSDTVQGPNASLPFNDVCWGTNSACFVLISALPSRVALKRHAVATGAFG